eukprot:9447829-Alexandrium_andersonii.AAC.1
MAVRQGRGNIGHVAKAWRFQGEYGRGNRSGVRTQPTILPFARSRAWTRKQRQQAQRIANLA